MGRNLKLCTENLIWKFNTHLNCKMLMALIDIKEAMPFETKSVVHGSA
jgi:hypothetical protein